MIPNNYDYLQHSFLSSVSNAITDAPRKLLQEHYRCHPKIIEFCNKKFYDGNLIIMIEDKGEKMFWRHIFQQKVIMLEGIRILDK